MADEKKKDPRGRKIGWEVDKTQFDDLMKSLNKTRREVTELLGSTLTPQAVSSWRSEGSIPFAYANRLASELLTQLKSREPTDLDKRVLESLKSANVVVGGSALVQSNPLLDPSFPNSGLTQARSKSAIRTDAPVTTSYAEVDTAMIGRKLGDQEPEIERGNLRLADATILDLVGELEKKTGLKVVLTRKTDG